MSGARGSAPGSVAGAISASEFRGLMDVADPALAGAPPSLFLAGVSGGADSLALALLLARWCRDRGHIFRALIVDHGLRPGSAQEAASVRARLQVRDIDSEILCWDGVKPATGIQAAARAARFTLLLDRACALGGAGLFLAHHLGDQAETMIMRLARDSGPDGLAGIRRRQYRAGIAVLRPLLGIPPARLRLHCLTEAGIWVEDPGNRDCRFERVRVRGEAARLAAAGLTAARLHRLAGAFAGLAGWSDARLTGFLRTAAVPDPRGFLHIDPGAVAGLPGPLRRKLLGGILQAVGGREYPPRGAGLSRLEEWFLARKDNGAAGGAGAGWRTTLAGCLLWKAPDGLVRIVRETPREMGRETRPQALAPGRVRRWDGRFDIVWNGPRPVWLHMLARAGERRLCRSGMLSDAGRALPQSVRSSLPAVTDLDGRVFAPHLCRIWSDGAPVETGLLRIRFRPAISWVADAFRPCGDDKALLKD